MIKMQGGKFQVMGGWGFLFLFSFILLLSAGCKGGKPGKPKKTDEETNLKPSRTKVTHVDKKPCFKKSWGPVRLSSGKDSVTGVSAATAIGQVGAMWVESGGNSSEVFFARIAGSGKKSLLRITNGASAYPPSALAWTGKEFALAWGDDRFRRIEIFIARISPAGKITLKPRQFTETKPSKFADVYTSDSSQEPALAYYQGNLLIAWGGPGDYGRQQVYHTTISKKGKPIYSPCRITSGPFNHTGLNLISSMEGASLHFCVMKGEDNEIYRTVLSGTPPQTASPLSKVASTIYSPCRSMEVFTGEKSAIMWAERKESGGITENALVICGVRPDGSYEDAFQVETATLVKFPGKSRRAFDAASAGGNVAVAWADAPPGGGQGIRAGIFSVKGKSICRPLDLETHMGPSDPRILYSGYGEEYVVLWVDREMGGKIFSLYAGGIEIL